jgi:hypothetical protein
MAGLKPDLASQARRCQPRRAFDLLGIWVNAHGALDQTGNPTGETAVTASHVQDTGPTQWRVTQEHLHFHPLGISSQASHLSHLFRPWNPAGSILKPRRRSVLSTL